MNCRAKRKRYANGFRLEDAAKTRDSSVPLRRMAHPTGAEFVASCLSGAKCPAPRTASHSCAPGNEPKGIASTSAQRLRHGNCDCGRVDCRKVAARCQSMRKDHELVLETG